MKICCMILHANKMIKNDKPTERGFRTVGKKMLFVFNPKAGKGKIKTHLLDIIDVFSSHDYEITVRSTQAPRDAYEKAKEYADKVDIYRLEAPMTLPTAFSCPKTWLRPQR